jgi:hypothetical protein
MLKQELQLEITKLIFPAYVSLTAFEIHSLYLLSIRDTSRPLLDHNDGISMAAACSTEPVHILYNGEDHQAIDDEVAATGQYNGLPES